MKFSTVKDEIITNKEKQKKKKKKISKNLVVLDQKWKVWYELMDGQTDTHRQTQNCRCKHSMRYLPDPQPPSPVHSGGLRT